MPANDRENMQALAEAIERGDRASGVQLARELSAMCDDAGVLRQWLEVRPLLDAVALMLAGDAAACGVVVPDAAPRWHYADVTGREVLWVAPFGSAFVAPASHGRFYAHARGEPLTVRVGGGVRLATYETREGARAAVLSALRR